MGDSPFAEPQPFEEKENGAVIVTSITGDVFVVIQNRDRYSHMDRDPEFVIVGESIGPGSTLITDNFVQQRTCCLLMELSLIFRKIPGSFEFFTKKIQRK